MTDSTTEQFLLVFRRFCARKPVPTTVVSDNATYFIAGESAIKTILGDDAIQQHFSKNEIKWIHIPGRSPAWGGLYERLVGIDKNTLKKIVGKALLTQTELHTILKETEAKVNNRPLTYVESDTTPTSPIALTPSHLINGRILSALPHLEEPEDNIIEKDLGHMQANQRLFYLTQLQQSIWNRWRTEYQSFLRERQEANKRKTSQITAAEGDIVLLYDDTPLSTRKRGRIEELYKGNDGQERSARIRTQRRDITRALYKMYPLELTTTQESKPDEPAEELQESNTSEVEM